MNPNPCPWPDYERPILVRASQSALDRLSHPDAVLHVNRLPEHQLRFNYVRMKFDANLPAGAYSIEYADGGVEFHGP